MAKKNEDALSMLQNISSYDLKGKMGAELLHFAVGQSNDVVTEHLIDLGVNVDVLNYLDNTPLMTALVENADEKTVTALLRSKANIYYFIRGRSILEFALSSNSVKCTVKKDILEYVKRDSLDDNYLTAEKLLHAKCKLYNAVLLKNVKILKIMLNRGCLVSDREPDSARTALHVAVSNKDLDTIKFLLHHGADINATDRTGLIALVYATQYNESPEEYEILNYLLDRGSSLSSLLVRPGHIGHYIDQKAAILITGRKAVVRTLILRHIIDFTTQDHSGKTSLHHIAENTKLIHNQCIFGDLLHLKIDANILDNDGRSPLHDAAAKKNSSMASFLFRRGANVNQLDGQNISALYLATKCPSYSTRNTQEKRSIFIFLEILLLYGADPQLATSENLTVIDNIIQDQSYDLAKPILAYLVLHVHRGGSITELIRSKIDANQILRKEFELCQRDLAEIKQTSFSDSLTAYDLMFFKEKKIVLVARNEEVFDLMTKFYNSISSNSYYFDFLKRRLEKILWKVTARRKVSDFLCQILACDYYAIHGVIDKITD